MPTFIRRRILYLFLTLIFLLVAAKTLANDQVISDHSDFIAEVRSNENIGVLVFTSPYCAPCQVYKKELFQNLDLLEKEKITLCVLEVTEKKNMPYVEYYRKVFHWKGEIPATIITNKEGTKGVKLETGKKTIAGLFTLIKTCFKESE